MLQTKRRDLKILFHGDAVWSQNSKWLWRGTRISC